MSGQSMQTSLRIYDELMKSGNTEAMRKQVREDLFFLLTVGCKRKDIIRPFLYSRCREVESDPNGNLDLWARDHYKSTIITFGLTIQDILKNPEETFSIFSHTRPIAKGFLGQIKTEFETNTFLKDLFPDILWADPQKESTKWSLDDGITVKRKTNPKEQTIEAWGLVDSQPTSRHYTKQIYDDVVTRESVGTPEMIQKTTSAWEMSLNLGSEHEGRICVRRYSGTRYHMNDTYKVIIDREAARPRYHYPTDLGQEDIDVKGNPYLLTIEQLREKRKNMGPYTYGSQMLQNPIADRVMGFKAEWLLYYAILKNHQGWNYYLLVDPSSGKKKSDYSTYLVIALAPDNNYYLVDGCRDRLNLTERCDKLFYFHRKWPIKRVGYEQYGMQADIEHIQYRQGDEGYRFHIEPVSGNMTKEDRIRKLVPVFESGRFYLPHRLLFKTKEDKLEDLTAQFISEYIDFPVASHDDIIDNAARIVDEKFGAVFPKFIPTAMGTMTREKKQDKYDVLKGNTHGAKIV